MFKKRSIICLLLTGFLILVFDARTALEGAHSGIRLCLYTVVPALFPFIFLSSLLVDTLSGTENCVLRKIGAFLGMPPGSEAFLLTGFLGGYPTGAACIAGAYRSGQIRKEQAERLLSFCSNAGPAFIFGIAGSMFSLSAAWLLWGVHILSALITALLNSAKDLTPVQPQKTGTFSASASLTRTVQIMASVCGWIILFRILIVFCERWFLWLLPPGTQALFSGILELSNGCCGLDAISSVPLRFVLFSFFLAFGGFCVMMQTATAIAPLSLRAYIIGKLVQSIFSILLSVMVLPFLHNGPSNSFYAAFSASILCLILATAVYRRKKTVAFQRSMIYNG